MTRPFGSAMATLSITLLLSNSSLAQGLPVSNSGFELWPSGAQLPAWNASLPLPDAARDCQVRHEGQCSLHLSAQLDPGKPFIQIHQTIPATAIKDGMVKLSGWIKVANHTKGTAALWMRVDNQADRPESFDNMGARAPKGNADWQKFEIRLPVTAQSGRVVFGALFAGDGDAWFDDLTLERIAPGDATASVQAFLRAPPATLPAMRGPRSAGAFSGVLTGASGGAVSTVPIDIGAADFADLQLLKPLLKDRRIVALGESAHGVAQFSQMKLRLIRFLHEQLGFNVIAFESPIAGCEAANRGVGKVSGEAAMRQCLFAVWHTEETVALFEYITKVRKDGGDLQVVGFDIQDEHLSDGFTDELASLAGAGGAALAIDIGAAEAALPALLQGKPATADTRKLLLAYEAAERALEKVQAQSGAAHSAVQRLGFLRSQLTSRIALLNAHTSGENQRVQTEIRDAAMAANLAAMMQQKLAGKKVIVWGHNSHIAKAWSNPAHVRGMGALLKQMYGDGYYAMGLIMNRGEAAMNTRRPYTVTPAPPGTLEHLLSRADLKAGFVDLSAHAGQQGNEWMSTSILTRNWGMRPIPIVPNGSFDGVIQVEVVNAPRYLGRAAAP